MILLSNTIGSARESVAEVRKMASLRGRDGDCDERLAGGQVLLSANALLFYL